MSKKKNVVNDMLGLIAPVAVYGAASSVVGSMTPSSGIGKTVGSFAQTGMGIMTIKHISKKIKY